MQPEFRDYSPAFDPQGRYRDFFSVRTFDPVYESVQFELSFPRAARPYLIALQAGGRPPFDPLPKGLKHEDPRAATGGAESEPSPPRIGSIVHRTLLSAAPAICPKRPSYRERRDASAMQSMSTLSGDGSDSAPPAAARGSSGFNPLGSGSKAAGRRPGARSGTGARPVES